MVLPIGTIIVLFLLAAIFNVIDSYVYLLFIAGSIFLGGLLNKTNNKHPKVCFLMLLSLVTYLTVFIGLRDFGVGTDTMVYVDSYWFNSANVNSLKDFYGFDYVSKAYLMLGVIGHLFSDDHQTMLVMTALTINFFTFLAIYIFNYRNLKVNWVIFILFWQLNCMNETMNVMRQDCAESLMLLTFVLALKQRWIWMILAAFIGFQFHSTSLILILLVGYYFLDRYFGRLKRNWLTILGLTLLVIFIIGVFKYSSMLINAGYLNDHFDVYTDNQTFSGINLFGPSYLLMTLVYFYIVWYLRRKKYISNSGAYFLNICYGFCT